MAAVVLGCLLMSLLVGIIMASWAEQKRLLGDVLVSPGSLSTACGSCYSYKVSLSTAWSDSQQLDSHQYSLMPDRSATEPDMLQW